MSVPSVDSANAWAMGQRSYDRGEVEAYIRSATETIDGLNSRIEEALARVAAAERALEDRQTEAVNLGRALLVAEETASQTVARAEAQAEQKIRAAEARAAAIVAAAPAQQLPHREATAQAAAAVLEVGERPLVAALGAYVEQCHAIRAELARLEQEAASWRRSRAEGVLRP